MAFQALQRTLSYLGKTATQYCNISTASVLCVDWHGDKPREPTHWLDYNKKMYSPQMPGEPHRPAYVCHAKFHIKYSPEKMWFVACMIRGLSIEEAIHQLKFVQRKGALFIKDTLLEAQQIAVQDHNVEFKTNLWVAESFVGKGCVIRGVRRHARKRFGKVEYKYCHYFVRLEEGVPPKHYYSPDPTGEELLQKYIERLRDRPILVTN